MFEIDLKRIKACIYYEDYYSALIYINLILENYTIEEHKQYFYVIIKMIKTGNYDGLKRILLY